VALRLETRRNVMAILLDENTEVVVQGATGKEGQFRIVLMRQYGTRLVAGVTPGRGGSDVAGLPVYDTVEIGPNSIGLVSPGKAILGVIGGRLELMQAAFRPGPCGVLSRSGGQTTTLCYYLTKPVVAYVSGRYARAGMRFGHAGAIISRGIGTAEAKIAALRDAGVHVVEPLGDIGPAARRSLDTLP
jgi:succinyl-CoA synthetase alpha subunit